MTDWKADAEALRLAIGTGVTPVSEAIAWADRQISATTAPPIALIDVSISARAGIGAVVSALGRIPGEANAAAISLRVLALMRTALDRDPKVLRKVVKALEQMAVENLAPSEQARNEMSRFDDALGLADQQVSGNLESVLAEVQDFVRRYEVSSEQ